MAKYLVETYYTCNIKVSHYLEDISENTLKNLEKQEDGKLEILDMKLDNRKTRSLDKKDSKEIDFDKLPQGINEFPFELPNSKRAIILRFLTHKDEKEIEKEAEALKKVSNSIVATMTSRMKRLIISVDGNSEKQHIHNFVDTEFLSVDSLELRKYLNSINPDINMTTIATFPDGTEQEVAVEITAQFFWPSA